jgi:hypothetical protein
MKIVHPELSNHLGLARLSVSIPLLVAALTLVGDIYCGCGINDERFVFLWLLACGVGSLAALATMLDGRSGSAARRVAGLAVFLNVAVALCAVFAYAITSICENPEVRR